MLLFFLLWTFANSFVLDATKTNPEIKTLIKNDVPFNIYWILHTHVEQHNLTFDRTKLIQTIDLKNVKFGDYVFQLVTTNIGTYKMTTSFENITVLAQPSHKYPFFWHSDSYLYEHFIKHFIQCLYDIVRAVHLFQYKFLKLTMEFFKAAHILIQYIDDANGYNEAQYWKSLDLNVSHYDRPVENATLFDYFEWNDSPHFDIVMMFRLAVRDFVGVDLLYR
jgi:hypothetical protein